MKIGFIGLGRMGSGMVERLLRSGKKVVVWNRSQDKVRAAVRKGAEGSREVDGLIEKLGKGRRIVWLMLPAGKVTDEMIETLLGKLRRGDIIIDGANDFYKNAERHGRECKRKGVYFFDVGVSGGVHGLKNGYTLMAGGNARVFKEIEHFFKALAPKGGYGYFGEVGSGHFVKSVHNIVEYVYLQGIAEGVELLDKKGVDAGKALEVWRPASVVNSWLVDLAALALKRGDFDKIGGEINSVTAKELEDTKKSVGGYAPAFDVARKIRRSSLDKRDKKFKLGKRTIAAVRREFGGHSVEKK